MNDSMTNGGLWARISVLAWTFPIDRRRLNPLEVNTRPPRGPSSGAAPASETESCGEKRSDDREKCLLLEPEGGGRHVVHL